MADGNDVSYGQEWLISEINAAAALYKKESKQKSANKQSEDNFKYRVNEAMKLFVGSGDVVSQAHSTRINDSINVLFQGVQKHYSKNFVRRWVASVGNFFIRKKSGLQKAVNKQIEHANERKAIRINENYLKQIKQYDLLDNLTDMEKLNSLSDDDLKTLYKLTVLEPSLNGIDINDNKFSIRVLSEKAKGNVPREEMLNDMVHILNDRQKFMESPLTSQEINQIKVGKVEVVILNCESNTSLLLGERKAPEVITELRDKMNELRDLYILKEMAHDITQRLAKSGIKDKGVESYVFKELKNDKDAVLEAGKLAESMEDYKVDFVEKTKYEYKEFNKLKDLQVKCEVGVINLGSIKSSRKRGFHSLS